MTRHNINAPAAATCVACLAMVSIAHAKEYPVSLVAGDATCHSSIRDAAADGIRSAAALSRRVEYGGAVFRRGPECFVHSIPVTSHQSSRVEYLIQNAHGHMLLVGIFHTHTPGGHASEFSPHDREEQRRLGIPSYVGVIGARSHEVAIHALGEALDLIAQQSRKTMPANPPAAD